MPRRERGRERDRERDSERDGWLEALLFFFANAASLNWGDVKPQPKIR